MTDFQDLRELVETFREGSGLRATVERMTERILAEPETQVAKYACYVCSDTAYVIGKVTRRNVYAVGDVREFTEAKPCKCRAGQAVRAGQWFEVVYPSENGTRVLDERRMDEFRAVCMSDGAIGEELRRSVGLLLRKYEAAKRRKIAAAEGKA